MKWIIIATLILCFQSCNQSNNETQKFIQDKNDSTENVVKLSVEKLVKDYNAVYNWDEKLSPSDNFKLSFILTYELEKLWLVKRPILFICSIEDIKNKDNSNYTILVKRNFVLNSIRFSDPLKLVLECEKEKIDNLIRNHNEVIEFTNFVHGGIAVIANITEIESMAFYPNGDEEPYLKVGKGTCLDIVFIGDVKF